MTVFDTNHPRDTIDLNNDGASSINSGDFQGAIAVLSKALKAVKEHYYDDNRMVECNIDCFIKEDAPRADEPNTHDVRGKKTRFPILWTTETPACINGQSRFQRGIANFLVIHAIRPWRYR